MSQNNVIICRQIFAICNVGAKSSLPRGDTENVVSDLKNPDVLTDENKIDEIGSGYHDDYEGSSFELNIKFR